MGAEANLEVGVLTLPVEEGLALVGVDDDAASHGCGSWVQSVVVTTPLCGPGPLSLWLEAI